MLNRHQSREIAVQALFNLDFRGNQVDPKNIYQYVLDEFYSQQQDDYSEKVFLGVLENQEKIDEIISAATINWPFEKIAIMDRNILRLGIFEMLFNMGSVPPRVAMNEAIELAKTFGGKNSFKFISGVLGSVYDNSSLKEKDTGVRGKKKEEDYIDAPIEKKAGAVVFTIKNKQIYLAMVYDLFGYWTLPKGTIHEDDDLNLQVTARRKVKEEIGIDVEILEKIGENIYNARNQENQALKNKVTYFLAQSEYLPLKLEQENEGLVNAQWVTVEEMAELNKYDDVTAMIANALKIINEKYL